MYRTKLTDSMIPNQAKKRQPNELVLATFRITYDKWEKFQAAANAAGTTASASLLAFIEDYLAKSPAGTQAHPSDSPSATEVPTRLDGQFSDPAESKFVTALNSDLQAEIEQKIQEIVHLNINGIETKVSRLSKRLEQVEQNVSKLKGVKQKKATELIDINAMPIDSDLSNDDLDSDGQLGEDYDVEAGLTQTALCTEFGINPNSLNRHARMRGLSNKEYLHQLTGWVYHKGKYYPPQ